MSNFIFSKLQIGQASVPEHLPDHRRFLLCHREDKLCHRHVETHLREPLGPERCRQEVLDRPAGRDRRVRDGLRVLAAAVCGLETGGPGVSAPEQHSALPAVRHCEVLHR